MPYALGCNMTTSDVFAALSNPTRREVLDLLHERPRAVSELAEHFDMRRPSLSEHLKVLRDVGLVAVQQQGRRRIYRLDPRPLREVAEWLHPYEAFWRDRPQGLRAMLDDEDATP